MELEFHNCTPIVSAELNADHIYRDPGQAYIHTIYLPDPCISFLAAGALIYSHIAGTFHKRRKGSSPVNKLTGNPKANRKGGGFGSLKASC